MWDRWQKGDSLHEIARLFNRHHGSVRGILERTGGIRPPTRRRSSRSLTLTEREKIAGRLKRLYPHDEDRRVSHETIYKTLFIQARGALKKALVAHLRRHRTMRRSRHHTQKTPRPWSTRLSSTRTSCRGSPINH